MDEQRQGHSDKYQHRYQHGPDMLPFTGGNELATFQRLHDTQGAPQGTGAVLATTLGSLLLLALVLWLLLP